MKLVLIFASSLLWGLYAHALEVAVESGGLVAKSGLIICAADSPVTIYYKVEREELIAKSGLLGELISKVDKDRVRIVLDYKNCKDAQIDEIVFLSKASNKTTNVKYKIAPVRVSLKFSPNLGAGESNVVWMADDAPLKLTYKTSPWSDELKSHVSFEFFSTLQGSGVFSMDENKPSAQDGSLNVKCVSNNATVSGMVPLLSNGTECGSRLAMHYGYQSKQLELSQPSAEEREVIKKVIKEKIDGVNDEKLLEKIKRFRGILLVHRVPYIEEVLKEMPLQTYSIAGVSEIQSLILDLSAYSLKFATPPKNKNRQE